MGRFFRVPSHGLLVQLLQSLSRVLVALRDDFADAPLFVLKDPRICRIVPFWLNVLKNSMLKQALLFQSGIRLVAASLKHRDGLELAKSFLLWLQHFLLLSRLLEI